MKKKLALCLTSFLFLVCILPLNIEAKETLITCSYEYKTEKLTYHIKENNSLIKPFQDGKKISNTINLEWYHEDEFEKIYLSSAKIDDKTFVCPSLTIEESDNFITIFNHKRELCNGVCTTVYANEVEAKKEINTKEIVSEEKIGSVGIYQDSKYFTPYFRVLNDGTKQWSINGKKYISVEKNAVITIDNKETTITLSKELINKIFTDKEINKDIPIYRCVKKTKKGYIYTLTLESKNCPKEDISTKDNQAEGSKYAEGSFGEDEENSNKDATEGWLDDYDQEQKCTGSESLLGDPNDEDSVAWLLQQILNYIKILGPMIVVIMSSIDFVRAIVQSDDEILVKAEKKLVIRLLLAASLFFIPLLVQVLLDIFGLQGDPTCGLK